MEYLALFVTVVLAHLVMVISPGPDFIVATKNSLTYSKKIGIWTAAGFGLGIALHCFYCIFGLAIIISQNQTIFTIVKILGGLYLVYLGLSTLFSIKNKTPNQDIIKEKKGNKLTALGAVKMGFLTNALNPKATLFFLSLFTLVITPKTPLYISIFLSLIMIINTFLWFSAVAIFFSQKKVANVFQKNKAKFNLALGLLLTVLGIKLLFF